MTATRLRDRWRALETLLDKTRALHRDLARLGIFWDGYDVVCRDIATERDKTREQLRAVEQTLIGR